MQTLISNNGSHLRRNFHHPLAPKVSVILIQSNSEDFKKTFWKNFTLSKLYQTFKAQSMECSSMVSIAAFSSGDSGSNPNWFAVFAKKLSN